MSRILDIGSTNPRIQCAVCGRWMRLHNRKTGDQRFYGSCRHSGGNEHPAAKPDNSDVCSACCDKVCRANAQT